MTKCGCWGLIMSDSGYIWLFVAVFGCFLGVLGVYWVFYGIFRVNGCVGGVFWSSDVFWVLMGVSGVF